MALSLAVTGCASHSLLSAQQSGATRDRERALASGRAAIRAGVRRSGGVGALAFLAAADGHLVVLPGDSPADAWTRYTGSTESANSTVSTPPVVTFVYRADIPKA